MKLTKQYFDNFLREFHYFYNTPYARKKKEITCFSEDSSLTINTTNIAELEEDYSKCYTNQNLLGIKNLARYDCFQDNNWSVWLDICKTNNKDFDGLSPVFQNNEYIWRKVKVLDFDEVNLKFKIIFLHSDQIKFVSRLSLLFFDEDKSEFEYRKYLCEKRRTAVDEFLLFTRYIDNIPDNKVSKLSQSWERKIIFFLKFSTKRLAYKFNRIFSSENLSFVREIKLIRQDFLRQMKKCRILIEMQEEGNASKFEARSLKIQPFFNDIKTPLYGINLGKRNQKDFSEKRKYLNQKSFFEDKYLSQVIVQFLRECEKLKKMNIILNNFEDNILPLTFQDFEIIRDKHNNNSEYTVVATCMHTLRNLIIDGLGHIEIEKTKEKKYDFYMVDSEEFPESRVKRVLQYFDLILFNKIKKLVNYSIDSYMKLFRQYSDNIKNRFEFIVPVIPLFVIKIKINSGIDDKKKLKNKKDGEKEEDFLEKLIIFDPPLWKFKENLINSFTHLKNVVWKISDLTSLAMKVIDIPKRKIFLLDENYKKYKDALDELNGMFEIAKNQANLVKIRYNKYDFLLTQSAENFVKNKFGEKSKTQNILDIEECKKLLTLLYDLGKEIDESEQEINLKMFRIQTEEIRFTIKDKIKQIIGFTV